MAIIAVNDTLCPVLPGYIFTFSDSDRRDNFYVIDVKVNITKEEFEVDTVLVKCDIKCFAGCESILRWPIHQIESLKEKITIIKET